MDWWQALLSKDMTSRCIQKPELSWLVNNDLCQSEPVQFGRGDHLLQHEDTNIKNQESQKNQVNVTSPKETNKTSITDPKEIKNYECQTNNSE